MLNGYALENSLGVYTGQRETAPNQRVSSSSALGLCR